MSTTIDRMATAGMVRPIVASAEPSARLRLVCKRSAFAARTAATPSGARINAAISTPSTAGGAPAEARSEEHTSELQSLMRISYAVFCLKKKTKNHKLKHQKCHTEQHTQTYTSDNKQTHD